MTTTAPGRHAAEQSRAPLPSAGLPTGAGTIGWLGPLLAVLLVGVAVLLGQDAWVRLNGGSTTWLGSVVAALDGLAPAPWMAAVGVVLVLVGLWLVLKAFGRRKRDALALRGSSGAHLTTGDVARLVTGAASQVDGVLDARTSASRRTATLSITTTGTPGTESQAQQAAERALSALASPPRVRVRATTTGDPS